ncbi:Clp protease N-terminal domain-containing protein [Streptomyces sp. NPDC003393]
MFERFTKEARQVVTGAVEQAEGMGARYVDPEHLLLGLLDQEGSRVSFALAALGLGERKESVRRAVREARRRAGLSRAETEALAGLGIDVTDVVARVEAAHGAGAMAAGRTGADRKSGHRPFGKGAKEILTGALRTAVTHRDRHIGGEHLLVALTLRPGVAAEILADHGVTYESLTRVLYGTGQAAAG